MFRKGDTLIEVMLAIAIFSMVAIAVVSVISSSVAGAETSLETTLAREEIDAQADALRFIQTAAVADNTASDDRFNQLWQKIIENAVTLEDKSETERNNLTQFIEDPPTTCDAAYSFPSGVNPFIINTRALGTFASASQYNSVIGNVLIRDKLLSTPTYPHLVFGNATSNTDNQTLSNDTFLTNSSATLYRALGIYVIAVADPQSTQVIYDGSTANINSYTSAYYDFYIRTCWYGLDANQASSIATVVRLHDPNVVQSDSHTDADYESGQYQVVTFNAAPGRFADYGYRQTVTTKCTGRACTAPPTPVLAHYDPDYWEATDSGCSGRKLELSDKSWFEQTLQSDGVTYCPGYNFKVHEWKPHPYIDYHTNGGVFPDTNSSSDRRDYCTKNKDGTFDCSVLKIEKEGYQFLGWRDSARQVYIPGESSPTLGYYQHVDLYAVFAPKPIVDANGGTFSSGASWVYAECNYHGECKIPSSVSSRLGYEFLGYSTSANASANDSRFGTVSGTSYSARSFSIHSGYQRIYAVWHAKYLLQNINEWGDGLSTKSSLYAVDSRDGKAYQVTKLSDGRIWFAQDLTFTQAFTDSSYLVTRTDTNVSWNTKLYNKYNADNTWINNLDYPLIHIENNTVYYNYFAATAGTNNAYYSVCPANWHISTATDWNSANAIWARDSEEFWLLQFQSTGRYNGSVQYDGGTAYYWTSGEYLWWVVSLDDNNSDPVLSDLTKTEGMSIRCVTVKNRYHWY